LISKIHKLIAHLLPSNPFTLGVSILVSGTALSQLLLAAAAPLLTRLYTPEDFGLLAVYTGILAILGVIASLRYELAIPLPEDDQEAVHIVTLCLVIVLSMTFFFTLLVISSGNQMSKVLGVPILSNYLWLLPISFLILGSYTVFNYWAIRTKHFSTIAGTKLWQAATTLMVQLLFFKVGGLMMMLGTAGGQLVGTFILGKKALAHTELNTLSLIKIKQAARRYWKFPVYSTWAGIFNAAGTQLPPLMFAALFSPGAAGLYFLAHRILTLPMSLIGNSVGNVFFANAVEAHREGKLGELVENVHDKLAQIAMPPISVLLICGPELSALVFGQNWRQAGDFAQWLAIPLYTAFITSPISTVFSILGRQRTGLHLQILLFVLRVSAIIIGAIWGDLITAVALFSIGSVIGYLFYISFLIHLSNANFIIIAKSFLSSIFVTILCLLPLFLYSINKDLYLLAGLLVFLFILVRYGIMIKDI
jgi:O-antigen/teichoic acid export membrane protein